MNLIKTAISGVVIFEPRVFGDERGFFVETFRDSWAREAGIVDAFVQENQSRSRRGVVRGLHFQRVQPQGKLVRVSRGRVFDVAVDIRVGSPTFGQSVSVILDDVEHRQFYIPPDFAHGFMVLSESADFCYKCTDYYHPASEAGVLWNDPALAIPWPDLGHELALSDKDRAWSPLSAIDPALLPVYRGES